MKSRFKQFWEIGLLATAAGCLVLGWWLQATPRVYFQSLEPVTGMSEAGFHYYSETERPAAIVLLANMYNNTRRTWIDDPVWRRFARENQCALVELAFASPLANLSDGSGYYFPARGSGALLSDALDRLWPEQPPLLLYGFSGGAQFVARFAAWSPERVKGWAAYAAGSWDDPLPMSEHSTGEPPGVVICGELDSRWQPSSAFFRAGHALGKPWLWIGITGNDHEVDARMGVWVARYFNGILSGSDGKWMKLPDERGWLAVGTMESEWRTLSQLPPYDPGSVTKEDKSDDEAW